MFVMMDVIKDKILQDIWTNVKFSIKFKILRNPEEILCVNEKFGKVCGAKQNIEWMKCKNNKSYDLCRNNYKNPIAKRLNVFDGKLSVRTGSILFNTKLSLNESTKIMLHYIDGISAYMVRRQTKINENTIRKYFKMFDEIKFLTEYFNISSCSFHDKNILSNSRWFMIIHIVTIWTQWWLPTSIVLGALGGTRIYFVHLMELIMVIYKDDSLYDLWFWNIWENIWWRIPI